MKIVAFVPAKGASDRIKNKNLRILDGEELYKRKLRQLLGCPLIDDVYLDTESEDLIKLTDELPIKIIKRDNKLASNKTDGHELFANEVKKVKADIYIQALCTSPFIDSGTITRAIDILRKNEKYDSVVAVRSEKQYRWKNNRPEYGEGRIPNSVDLADNIIESMGLYIVRGDFARKLNRRFGKKPYLMKITPLESIDVNWPEDLELAQFIALGQKINGISLYNNLKSHMSSAMLSDIMSDFGLKGVLPRYLKPNLPAKVFGHAKTLEIGPIPDGDSWKGIYKGLDSYQYVTPGDVIVVSNKEPEFAYFGELNANLAIRSGAIGALIDGVTRDTDAVTKLGFPVFSRGGYCADIRKKGVVLSMNKPVTIENVTVSNNDLVFGDADGVVVIPKQYETKVIGKVLEGVKREKQILIDIAIDTDVSKILNKYGFF